MAKKWKALGAAATLAACIAMTGCVGAGLGEITAPSIRYCGTGTASTIWTLITGKFRCRTDTFSMKETPTR